VRFVANAEVRWNSIALMNAIVSEILDLVRRRFAHCWLVAAAGAARVSVASVSRVGVRPGMFGGGVWGSPRRAALATR
jgi:hypothetical protein